MIDRQPPPPVDDDELPPCIGAHYRDIARAYAQHQAEALQDAADLQEAP